MPDIIKFNDFTQQSTPISFVVDNDVFECLPEIPLDALATMTQITSSDNKGETIEKIYQLFDGIMTPESAERFRRRGRRGTAADPNPRPIGMRHVQQILPWLMEVYGLRPTQPSADSFDGSSTTDTSSTDGVLLTASTS